MNNTKPRSSAPSRSGKRCVSGSVSGSGSGSGAGSVAVSVSVWQLPGINHYPNRAHSSVAGR
jgi:hypothetical protein